MVPPFFSPFLLPKGIATQCNIRTRCFHCCSLAWLKASARPFVPSLLSPSHFIHFLPSIHSCQTRTLHARKPTKPNQCNDDDDEEDKGGIANMKAKHKKNDIRESLSIMLINPSTLLFLPLLPLPLLPPVQDAPLPFLPFIPSLQVPKRDRGREKSAR